MLRIASLLAALIAGTATPGQALGGIFSTSSDLPQTGWVYQASSDVLYGVSPGPVITLSGIQDLIGAIGSRVPFGMDERAAFDSTATGSATIPGLFTGGVTLVGPSLTNVHNRLTSPTGAFDTEMLALDLHGSPVPGGPIVMVRESPTLQSLGKTTIQPVGGGYQIDSFFDVYTEISFDNGQSWVPSNGSTRVTLTPEPGTWATLAVGLAFLVWMVRRRVA